jgi:hypothetical protein
MKEDRGNYRVPLVPIHFKVGTMSSSVWLVRKRDLAKLKPGGMLEIFSERYANPVSVLVEEFRASLWFVCRF